MKKFSILAQDFSIEDGELTPTQKMKRKIVSPKYQTKIVAMYQGRNTKYQR